MKKKVTVHYMVCNDKKSEEGSSGLGTFRTEQVTVEFTPKMEKLVKVYRMNLLKGFGIVACTEAFTLSIAALLGRAAGTREDGKSKLCDHPIPLMTFCISQAFMTTMIEETLWKTYNVDPKMPIKSIKKAIAYVAAADMIRKKYEDHTVVFLDK